MSNAENFTDNEITIDEKIEIATKTLERNIGFITGCDNKTSIVLAMLGVILTVVFTNVKFSDLLNIVNGCITSKSFGDVMYLLFLIFSFVLLISGIIKLCKVLIGNVNETARGINSTPSHIFFSGIQKNESFANYSDSFRVLSKEEVLNELLSQIYINSDIANTKYSLFNSGLKNSIIGLGLSSLLLLIGFLIY